MGTKAPSLEIEDIELPRGIHRSRRLPDAKLGALWKSIVIAEDLRERLLSQAILNFTVRPKVDRSDLPLHGVILLVGEPGTGKTSLAKGLAHRVSQAFPNDSFRLLEVEPHMLMSSGHGKSQKAVSDLFARSISETAVLGPTIVLLDEVETLAADRSKMSLEANPIDVHRATDAVLVQLDLLAERHPHLLFVATSNFPQAVDSAFTSRCDLVLPIPMPGRDACLTILRLCLEGLGRQFPALVRLSESVDLKKCAAECVGLDGRTIRKVVGNALASNLQTAADPNKVKLEDLVNAARAAKAERTSRGRL